MHLQILSDNKLLQKIFYHIYHQKEYKLKEKHHIVNYHLHETSFKNAHIKILF